MRPHYELSTLDFNILYVSKYINKEAKSFFFSQNVFNFACIMGSAVSQVFAKIRPENLSQMEHVMIQFPGGRTRIMAGSDNTFMALKFVQGWCKNLKTLTVSPYWDERLDPRFKVGGGGGYSEDAIRKSLKWYDVEFRAIRSLREIVVWVSRRKYPAEIYRYEEIGDFVEMEMERLGWRFENITHLVPVGWEDELLDWFGEGREERSEYK
jgi:hypothetical protein